MRNASKFFGGKFIRQHGRYMYRWDDNIKLNLGKPDFYGGGQIKMTVQWHTF
jgi:hypothetical protein